MVSKNAAGFGCGMLRCPFSHTTAGVSHHAVWRFCGNIVHMGLKCDKGAVPNAVNLPKGLLGSQEVKARLLHVHLKYSRSSVRRHGYLQQLWLRLGTKARSKIKTRNTKARPTGQSYFGTTENPPP